MYEEATWKGEDGVPVKEHHRNLINPGSWASLFGKAQKSRECFQTRSIFTKLCKALYMTLHFLLNQKGPGKF